MNRAEQFVNTFTEPYIRCTEFSIETRQSIFPNFIFNQCFSPVHLLYPCTYRTFVWNFRYWIHWMPFVIASVRMPCASVIWKMPRNRTKAFSSNGPMWRSSCRSVSSSTKWKNCSSQTHTIASWWHRAAIIWYRWLMKYRMWHHHHRCSRNCTTFHPNNFAMATIDHQIVDSIACAHIPLTFRWMRSSKWF